MVSELSTEKFRALRVVKECFINGDYRAVRPLNTAAEGQLVCKTASQVRWSWPAGAGEQESEVEVMGNRLCGGLSPAQPPGPAGLSPAT